MNIKIYTDGNGKCVHYDCNYFLRVRFKYVNIDLSDKYSLFMNIYNIHYSNGTLVVYMRMKEFNWYEL